MVKKHREIREEKKLFGLTYGDVASFCGPCDSYVSGSPCHINGEFDQFRYASRGWCGWAAIAGNGVHIMEFCVDVGDVKFPRGSNLRKNIEAYFSNLSE